MTTVLSNKFPEAKNLHTLVELGGGRVFPYLVETLFFFYAMPHVTVAI